MDRENSVHEVGNEEGTSDQQRQSPIRREATVTPSEGKQSPRETSLVAQRASEPSRAHNSYVDSYLAMAGADVRARRRVAEVLLHSINLESKLSVDRLVQNFTHSELSKNIRPKNNSWENGAEKPSPKIIVDILSRLIQSGEPVYDNWAFEILVRTRTPAPFRVWSNCSRMKTESATTQCLGTRTPRTRKRGNAAPALKLLLDDADGCVRVAAADALILLGCEDSACEPLLLGSLQHDDRRVRLLAAQCLSHWPVEHPLLRR